MSTEFGKRTLCAVSGFAGGGIVAAVLFIALGAPQPSKQTQSFADEAALPIESLRSDSIGPVLADRELDREPDSMRAALDMRSRGKYVLDSDIPRLQRFLSQGVESNVAAAMSRWGPEYKLLFRNSGVDDDVAAQLLEHISLVIRARVMAAHASTSFSNAREALDKRLRKEMGEHYTSFVEFEGLLPATIELDAIAQFARSEGIELKSLEGKKLRRAIAESHAYSDVSSRTYAGAFGDVPQSVTGSFAVPHLEHRLELLIHTTGELLANAEAAGVDKRVLEATTRYYENQSRLLQDNLQLLLNPQAHMISILQDRLENLKREPIKNRDQISALENQLSTLTTSFGP